MKIQVLRNIVENTNGKFFTVVFVKKDGSTRSMNCRLGVKRHLRGGNSTTEHKPELITVYDVKTEGYRNINLLTVKQIRLSDTVLYTE